MACTETTFPFPDSQLLVYHTSLFNLNFATAYTKYPLTQKNEEINPHLWWIQSLQQNKNSNCTYYGRYSLVSEFIGREYYTTASFVVAFSSHQV